MRKNSGGPPKNRDTAGVAVAVFSKAMPVGGLAAWLAESPRALPLGPLVGVSPEKPFGVLKIAAHVVILRMDPRHVFLLSPPGNAGHASTCEKQTQSLMSFVSFTSSGEESVLPMVSHKTEHPLLWMDLRGRRKDMNPHGKTPDVEKQLERFLHCQGIRVLQILWAFFCA